jgi:CSLREA domain-containing protein
VVTCSLGSLAPGQSAAIEIGATLAAGLLPGDVLTNEASFHLNELNQAAATGTLETTTLVVSADHVVNTLEDAADAAPGDGLCATSTGRCSLRAAIAEANSQPGAQTIALGAETYIVSPTLSIASPLTLVGLGAGRTTLAGGGADRVIIVTGGHAVTLEGLAITGGNTNGSGGGLSTIAGNLTMTGVQISGNYAAIGGGGLYVAGGGSLTLAQSAVTGNSSDGSGGGLLVQGTATLANVTISGNTAGSGGGIVGLGVATLTNVTVANNHATGSGGGLNGGPANFTLLNTILAGNTAAVAGPNCGYGLTSQGHNLIDNLADCAVSGATTGNITGQAAGLLPLALNGAATLTHALAPGSPALEAGTCALPADQRGVPRPQDGDLDQAPACDIGAYEFQPARLWLPVLFR